MIFLFKSKYFFKLCTCFNRKATSKTTDKHFLYFFKYNDYLSYNLKKNIFFMYFNSKIFLFLLQKKIFFYKI